MVFVSHREQKWKAQHKEGATERWPVFATPSRRRTQKDERDMVHKANGKASESRVLLM